MKNLGFSLIELMVVIAIVALLAAVAGPAYKNYIVSSKAAAAASALKGYADQSIQYFNTHNEFPTNVQLGVPNMDWNATSTVNGTNIWGIETYKNDLGPTACKAGGVMAYVVNYDKATQLPLTGADGDQILYVIYDFVDVNGTIRTWCSYYEINMMGGNMNYTGRILIPGCTERVVENPNLKNEIDAIATNGCT